ncbi:GNAT family N-acetyltransferase [Haploplasma axanthum]|nr:GNAT family N-acetyltransferase [Haploplasma axanthum]
MIRLVKSNIFPTIKLKENQNEFVTKEEKIQKLLNNKNSKAYHILKDDCLIGFILLVMFDTKKFFMQDFRIDGKYQGNGLGKRALDLLIEELRNEDVVILTTTYTYGNNNAKKLYEKIGFIETDIVDDRDVQEVNMIYRFEGEKICIK